MKKLTCLLTMACCFMLQGASSAAVVVRVGSVSGVSTNLDVRIDGGGTLGAAPFYIGLYDLKEWGLKSNTTFFAATHENNMGDMVTSLYNFYAVPLTRAIMLTNLTEKTSVPIEYLLFDNDPAVGGDPNQDDFNLVYFAPNGFLKSGQEWAISGQSYIALGKGNASTFTLGTYSYNDAAIGDVTVILQENTAIIPEASTALSFVLGVMLLLVAGRRKIIQKVSR